MTFQDRISKRLKKSDDFRYLEDLVNSGEKEVKLTSDVTLDSYEEPLFSQGIDIETDGLVIDGDGHIIDARGKTRIFRIENKKVTFKNITFKDGTAKPKDNSFESIFGSIQGGAVYAAESRLYFKDCTFENNSARQGGAVYLDYSQCRIEGCNFTENYGYEFAGAIFNDELSSLTIVDSQFTGNISFDYVHDIKSVESSLKVIGCKFTHLEGSDASIHAEFKGNLVLKDSKFNKANVIAANMAVIKDCSFNGATVDVSKGTLCCEEKQKNSIPIIGYDVHYLESPVDSARELSLHELAREFIRYFKKSENGKYGYPTGLHGEMVEFVEIWREIWSNDSNFLMADAIANVSTLAPEDIQDNYLVEISRKRAIDKESFDQLHEILDDVLETVEFPAVSFKYLDGRIHKENNIRLKSDIVLDEGEFDDYAEGIRIDVDGLVIDGNGHVIDAKNRASIFKIQAENVVIKNLVFKNAFSNMGGAVSNIGEVRFENCLFQENIASELGGAIVNDEKMIIDNCEFENNSSGGVGGAIAATFASTLEIIDSTFKSNAASLEIECPGEILPGEAQGFGGAIYNNGKLDINASQFIENRSDRSGAVMIVLQDSKININGTLFRDNYAKLDGGAIHTMGEININNSKFINNRAENNAGVFDATESSKLNVSASKFENNSAENGNVIYNRGELELFESFIGSGDIVDERNGDGIQNAMIDMGDTNEDDFDDESEDKAFPEGYDDYARRFKESFEEDMDEEDSKSRGLFYSMIFMIWADNFPEDANLIAAALILANIYDDGLVKIVIKDFSHDEYRRKLMDHKPIDEELQSWFLTFALMSMIFKSSREDESGMTSKEYSDRYIEYLDNFHKAGEDEVEKLYGQMRDFVEEWRSKYPEDSNMTLAYLAVNVPYLSDVKIFGLLEDLKSQSAGDEDGHERIRDECMQALKIRSIDLNDFLEVGFISGNGGSAFIKFIEDRFEEVINPNIDDDVRRYFKEFEQLNTTTSSIYDLGDYNLLIILKDGTNLTRWSDVKCNQDILYISEDLSKKSFLKYKYQYYDSLKAAVLKGAKNIVSSSEFMFAHCSSLEYVLGMDTWDTSNITDMTGMFMGCSSLRDISFLESFDVSNVETMKSLFQSCISLDDISPLKSWDVGNVEDMHAMFALCLNLASLEGLGTWDVGNVKMMESMFHQCISLSDISPLVGWNPICVENLFEMFRDCESLEDIDALADWDIKVNANVRDMFKYSRCRQKPDWYLNSTDEIEEHVNSMDDEEVLIDMAYNHSDLNMRKAAIARIADSDVLKDIILKNSEPAILEAAIKNRHLDDDDFLMEQMETENYSGEGLNFILFALRDDSHLARIAEGDYPLHYRLMAVNLICEKSLLEDISSGQANEAVRNHALMRLKNLE